MFLECSYGCLLISCTYNQETKSLFNKVNFFDFIKKDQHISIVNIARGPIVSIKAFESALKEKKHIYYYLDTADSYSGRDTLILNDLLNYNNLFSSPHRGGQAFTGILKAEMICLNLLQRELE